MSTQTQRTIRAGGEATETGCGQPRVDQFARAPLNAHKNKRKKKHKLR